MFWSVSFSVSYSLTRWWNTFIEIEYRCSLSVICTLPTVNKSCYLTLGSFVLVSFLSWKFHTKASFSNRTEAEKEANNVAELVFSNVYKTNSRVLFIYISNTLLVTTLIKRRFISNTNALFGTRSTKQGFWKQNKHFRLRTQIKGRWITPQYPVCQWYVHPHVLCPLLPRSQALVQMCPPQEQLI